MSQKLYSFFAGYSSFFYGNAGAGDPRLAHRFEFVEGELFDSTKTTTTLGTEYADIEMIRYYPNYSFLYLWQHLSRILILSNMPIQKEAVAIRADNGNAKTLEILNDFEIPPTADGKLKESVFFFPAGELRWSNFKASGPLKRLDIQLFIQLRNGNIIPLRLLPNTEASIKFSIKRRKTKKYYRYGIDDKATTGIL